MNKQKLESYAKLATYYDYLQRDIDYSVWQDWLIKYITSENMSVLEMGCGTGKIASFLKLNDVDIDAFDLSPQMIEVAKKNFPEINFFVADIVNFKSSKKYDVIIIFMDTINYITDEIVIAQAFLNIANALAPAGKVLFDIHKQDNQELFDDYYESGYIDKVEYRWHSTVHPNDIVKHNFKFKEENESFEEEHTQLLRDLKFYQEKYLKFFNEVEVTDDLYRHYITLQKKEIDA